MKFNLTLISFLILFIITVPAFAEVEWSIVEPAERSVILSGFTYAQAKMPLTAEVEGRVGAIFADIGEPISDANKFACLDDTFAQIDIKSAQREISRNYVDIKFYKKEVARHKKLVDKQTIAVNVLDKLERDLSSARDASSIASIHKQRLEEHRRRHCIEAPEGWLVIDRNIELGQWVRQGEVVANVGNYSQLRVPMMMSQKELVALKKNKEAIELYFTEYNLKVQAKIDHISPAFDEATRKTLVDLLITKSLPELQGGMRVSLTLKIPDSDNKSYTIDKRALEERYEEYWVQRKDGKSLRVKLLGEQANGKVTISSRDIKLGDQLKIVLH